MTDALPVHVTVVIPTRNEEAAIVDTIRSVPNDGWCKKLDFLIIDGNSTDKTRELAEQTQKEVQELRKKALDIQVSRAIGPQNLSEEIMTNVSDVMGLGKDIASVSGEVLMKKIAENYQNGKQMIKQAFAERAHPYTQGMVKQAAAMYGMIVELNKLIESSKGRKEVQLLEDRAQR